MRDKLDRLLQRLEELEHLLGQPETIADQQNYPKLTQEHAYLTNLKQAFEKYCLVEKRLLDDKKVLAEENDPDLLSIVKDEIQQLEEDLTVARAKVEALLVPPDPNDDRNVIVEIRAGTGGDEASLFVADCARMYRNFANQKSWTFEHLSSTPSEAGGFKEYIFVLAGKGAHRQMQYEGGTHRVQRVPATETQGRVHTSAITMAVLLEPSEQEKISIDETELRIETYRASGAGGQHVNVTDSAVRITHLPTGLVVTCQDERSQHKNKDKALRILAARLAENIRLEEEKKRSTLRASQVGSGDRSERIRTYNFPQNRVTDHRIQLTLYHLEEIMEGDLEQLTSALVSHFYQQKLQT